MVKTDINKEVMFDVYFILNLSQLKVIQNVLQGGDRNLKIKIII